MLTTDGLLNVTALLKTPSCMLLRVCPQDHWPCGEGSRRHHAHLPRALLQRCCTVRHSTNPPRRARTSITCNYISTPICCNVQIDPLLPPLVPLRKPRREYTTSNRSARAIPSRRPFMCWRIALILTVTHPDPSLWFQPPTPRSRTPMSWLWF